MQPHHNLVFNVSEDSVSLTYRERLSADTLSALKVQTIFAQSLDYSSAKYEEVLNTDSNVSYGMMVYHYTDDTRTTLDFTMKVEYIVPPSVHLNKSCGDVLKETHAKVLSFIDFLENLPS